MEKFKDVTIQGVDYRIGVFSPIVGGHVMLQTRRMLADEEIYTSILKNCLNVVAVLKDKNGEKFPFKLYSKEASKWIEPEIKDPSVLNAILMQATEFNLAPFIKPSNEQVDSMSQPDSSQPSSQTA